MKKNIKSTKTAKTKIIKKNPIVKVQITPQIKMKLESIKPLNILKDIKQMFVSSETLPTFEMDLVKKHQEQLKKVMEAKKTIGNLDKAFAEKAEKTSSFHPVMSFNVYRFKKEVKRLNKMSEEIAAAKEYTINNIEKRIAAEQCSYEKRIKELEDKLSLAKGLDKKNYEKALKDFNKADLDPRKIIFY